MSRIFSLPVGADKTCRAVTMPYKIARAPKAMAVAIGLIKPLPSLPWRKIAPARPVCALFLSYGAKTVQCDHSGEGDFGKENFDQYGEFRKSSDQLFCCDAVRKG
ncbi:hypothetical protein [Novosphingobium sp.]|uniref:hypothetical protein n=1 Tax=Novosphingobium sp. TaxID=1874826 RepID=UPI0031CFFE4D